MFSLRKLTLLAAVVALSVNVSAALEDEVTESPSDSPTLCPSVSCDCQAGEAKDWYVDPNGCVLCRCVLKPTKSTTKDVETTASATTTKPKCLEQPRKCRCRAGSYAVFYQDSNGCDVCGCKLGAAPSTTPAETTTRGETTEKQCSPMRNCRCKAGSTVIFFTNSEGCDRCACKKDGTETSTQATTTNERDTTTRAAPTTVTTTKAACPEVRDCKCAAGDYIIWHSDWRTGCRTSCSCLRGRATAGPTEAVTETRAETTRPVTTKATTTKAKATTTKATTTKATTTKAKATTTREATTRPPATRTTKPAVTTTRPASCGAARQCRCRSNAKLVLYRDDAGCEQCACKLLSDATTQAPTTTAESQCPKDFKERTCRCKSEAIAVYTTLDNGCRDCSCKLIAEASRSELADAAEREAAAASAATSAAVPVGITTLVVLSIVAVLVTYRRQQQKNKAARRASELTWDESGFQAASIELEQGDAAPDADQIV